MGCSFEAEACEQRGGGAGVEADGSRKLHSLVEVENIHTRPFSSSGVLSLPPPCPPYM